MKELVNKILNGREKIEDVYFVACGGSLVDLYPGYYFVRTESKTMHADWITSKEFVVTPPTLKFSALRHEMRVENEDGTTSEEIKRRTYDLKCSQQERTIQVSIPAEILVKDYPYNAEVELINPVADTVANANYRGADVEWYIKADDIVLKNKGGQPAGNPQGV